MSQVMTTVFKAITPNPFATGAQFRNDWRFCTVTIDGNLFNQKRICFASVSDGYIERYVYEDGQIKLDSNGQPETVKMEGNVEATAPAGYTVCPSCMANWKKAAWWQLAA